MLHLSQLKILLAGSLFCCAVFAEPGKHLPQVMGWVPAYGMQTSMAALESTPAIAQGLTRLGLQFWNPSSSGDGVVFAAVDQSGQKVDAAEVLRFRNWARRHQIKVFLTVYNNSQVGGQWDWALARRAFAEHPASFADALVREMTAYQLDGIDLDLEGEGEHEVDRAAFAHFVAELALRMKSTGKLLTIDSFHSPCDNAPNMRWWADWQGKVDAIHSMGYADLYEGSTEIFTPPGRSACAGGAAIFKYSWQLRQGLQAGYKPEQILLGLPTWLEHWGSGGLGTTPVAHVREVQALGAGLALWDLQLEAKNWRRDVTWQAIRALRRQPGAGWKRLSKD